MPWENETVLITGATGFVGGNVAARLVGMAANVISIERDHKPHNTLSALRVRDQVTTVTGDITDLALMQRVFAEYDVTYVFHFAAQAAIGAAMREPISTFEANIRGTWTTLEAARTISTLKGLVIASSDAAYGDHATTLYAETFPLLNRYPYGASKVCSDVLSQCYHATYGVPLAIARSANTYGPGDLNFSRLVPGAIRGGLANEPVLLRSSGSSQRDYIYVDDAVDGYLAVAENLGSGLHTGEVFNFGSGVSHSTIDVCTLIHGLTGSTARVQVSTGTSLESADHCLDVRKAQAQLQWVPHTTLERGLRRTVEWYRSFLNPDDGSGGRSPRMMMHDRASTVEH